MQNTIIVISIILAINLISFLLYFIDKRKAIKGKWRISENILILSSLFAPWGAFAGMRIIRHKTKHIKFKILVPVFMLLHVILVVGLVYLNMR